MILQEIKSIIDSTEFPKLLNFLTNFKSTKPQHKFILDSYILRLQFEVAAENEVQNLKSKYLQNIENRVKQIIPRFIDYKTSKTDPNIGTIRHGLNLLKRNRELEIISKKIIGEKAFCDLDNDFFVDNFNNFLTSISQASIIEQISLAFKVIVKKANFSSEFVEIDKALQIFDQSFEECVQEIKSFASNPTELFQFEEILNSIRLYNINKPFVALASNYGVPQNRERVLFIGCRKDQKLISEIPATISNKEKVTVFEALHDLDFINNDDERLNYEDINYKSKFNGTTKKMLGLLKKRTVDGKIDEQSGLNYSVWSKIGRLNGRFSDALNPFYVKTNEELKNSRNKVNASLLNHKTSKQNDAVIRRLEIILKEGDYEDAKEKLKAVGLDSDKRDYNVLKAGEQSPTVMTIADDYIHYSSPRALTVREMARLQSFDDSFVFQGKRSTGGNKRKYEVPQFTLVGNAVPPLLARAVALEILRYIE
jgi:DNA (cytosine-5)-methyltransferase 1